MTDWHECRYGELARLFPEASVLRLSPIESFGGSESFQRCEALQVKKQAGSCDEDKEGIRIPIRDATSPRRRRGKLLALPNSPTWPMLPGMMMDRSQHREAARRPCLLGKSAPLAVAVLFAVWLVFTKIAWADVKATQREREIGHFPVAPGGDVNSSDLEQATVYYVDCVGNQEISTRTLEREARLPQVGDRRNRYAVEYARRDVLRVYHRQGYNAARVTIVEGDSQWDPGVVFQISEGPHQRIRQIKFAGDTQTSERILRRQIQSRQNFLWIVDGNVVVDRIEEDVWRLAHHYRSLGYFHAHIKYELSFDENREWAVLTFMIDKGPRYRIHNISFVGNTKLSTEQHSRHLKLKAGQHFDLEAMDSDEAAIRENYGIAGYVFADVQVDLRLPEEPGQLDPAEPRQLDLIYKIRERSRCRVKEVRAKITSRGPAPPLPVIQDRVSKCVSLSPGDIVDVRECRATEQRLRSTGLFRVDPKCGLAPEIVLQPPDPPPPLSDRGSEDIAITLEIRGELNDAKEQAAKAIDLGLRMLGEACSHEAIKRLIVAIF